MPIKKDNTDKLIKEVGSRVEQNLLKAALLVERDAKILCPVDTGTLRRSITHKIMPLNFTAIVGSNVTYAPHVELGTYKMPAQPFLVPALHKNIAEIKKILKK